MRMLLPACKERGQFSLADEALVRRCPRCGPRVRQRRADRSCVVPPQETARSRAWRVLGFNVRKGLDAKYPDDRCTLHLFLRAFGPTIRDPGVSGIYTRSSDRSGRNGILKTVFPCCDTREP